MNKVQTNKNEDGRIDLLIKAKDQQKYNLKLLQQGRRFQVQKLDCINQPELNVCFRSSDGFENLDVDSDCAQVFGLSHRLKCEHALISTSEMKASDLETLIEALEKIRFATYDSEKI